MKTTIAIFLISSFAFAQSKSAEVLPLTKFIDQVKDKNEGYKGSKLATEGAADRVGESDLLTSPSFFISGQWANDESELTNANMGKRTIYNTYQIGLMQQTPIGLSGKVYYDMSYTDIAGATTFYVPMPSYYRSKPAVEGTLSLWRNLFGKEVRSNQEAMEASAKAAEYQQSYFSKLTLADAEGAYWRLALARRLKQVSSETLGRAQKLRDWNSRRVRDGLGDRSELLQAEGNLRLRELEFKSATDEERGATLMFNGQRGVNSEKVDEILEGLPDSKADFYKVSNKAKVRDDVAAALEVTRASRAAAEAGAEKNLPVLELYGSYAYSGLDRESEKAVDKALKYDRPTTAIGVRFIVPLEVGDLTSAHSGYKKEAAAAEYKYQRKLFEQERDWQDLSVRYKEAKERLALAEAFEGAQKEKYDYERSRHSHGRTTTFMVLQFEQDFALAQATRLRIQGEVLGLVAQMKTYGDSL